MNKAAIEAKFNMSEVEDLKWSNFNRQDPVQLISGPINFAPPNDFINLVDIAALCKAGMIKYVSLTNYF